MNDVVDLPVLDTAGTRLGGSKIVRGRVTLAGGLGTVTLTGAAVFASATSYHVVATDTTAVKSLLAQRISGSRIDFSDGTGVGADELDFVAVGI